MTLEEMKHEEKEKREKIPTTLAKTMPT